MNPLSQKTKKKIRNKITIPFGIRKPRDAHILSSIAIFFHPQSHEIIFKCKTLMTKYMKILMTIMHIAMASLKQTNNCNKTVQNSYKKKHSSAIPLVVSFYLDEIMFLFIKPFNVSAYASCRHRCSLLLLLNR